jgi:autotransporter-associated beta strand protein
VQIQRSFTYQSWLVAVALTVGGHISIEAQTFTPIALTPGSYTQCVVVPTNWPYRFNAQSVSVTLGNGPALQADTVEGYPTYYSIESSTGGETLFEEGFEIADPTYGMPKGGSIFTNITVKSATDKHVYLLPYWTNYDSNCLFIANFLADSNYDGLPLSGGPYVAQTYTSGSLTLLNASNPSSLNPNNYTALSFLGTCSGGPQISSLKIYYADGSSQSVPVFGLPGVNFTGGTNTDTGGGPAATLAWNCNARFNPAENQNTFDNTSTAVWAVDVGLSDTTSPATNVTFTYTSAGYGAVFAVSGGNNAADKPANTGPLTGPFAPIPISGFNAGCVVANASLSAAGLAPLTATMDSTTNLAAADGTWFEQGYDLAAPTNGFPAHGSTITSFTYPNRTYQLPANYNAPMSILIDTNHQKANITPVNTNIAYTAFSLLTAGSYIADTTPMSNYIILQHADGVNESNLFLGRDWYDTSVPYVWNANERIDITTGNGREVSDLDLGYPRLFEAEFEPVDGTPVTNIVAGFIQEPLADSTTFIFAISASTNFIPVELDSYTAAQNVNAGNMAVFSVNLSFGELPTYQWQYVNNGVTNNLANGATGTGSTIFGATTFSLMVSNVSSSDTGYYTCLIQNAAPSATNSPAAPLTLLSTKVPITQPTDTATDFYQTIGTPVPYPASGRGAGKILDGTLDPYQNYGGNGFGNTFLGPVGFVVTPGIGNSIITGTRIYTSTNPPADDPADFTVYGSSDSLHWTYIASSSLALPYARNGASGAINSNNQVLEEIDFPNTQPYLTYAVYFTNLAGGDAATNGVEFAEVQLLGTPSALPNVVWSASVNSAWDKTTLNWNSGVTNYTDPDFVQFDDTSKSANVSVAATVAPGGILVTNNVKNYVFNSSGGRIVGYGALVKMGSASLTILDNGGDTFAGGIIAGQGSLLLDQVAALAGGMGIGSGVTVQVGNNDANGSLPTGSITNNGSLIFDRTDSITNAGAISGAGTVTMNGTGTVTLSANSGFSGGVTINQGTLQVNGSGGDTALGSGNTVVNAGATLVGLEVDAFGYYNNVEPTNIFINGGTVMSSGTGNFRITLPHLSFNGGTLSSAPGNSGDQYGNFSLYGWGGKCLVTNVPSSTTATINAGSVGIQQNITFNIAAGTTPSGIDLLITSVLDNFGVNPITKTGAGVMEWTGVSVFTGSITNSAGTLIIGGSGQLGAGNYGEPIVNDGTLTFDSSASQILSGIMSGTGTLDQYGSSTLTLSASNTFTGNISIGSGGTLAISGTGCLGAGTYSEFILDNGMFADDSSTAQTLSGVIFGSGALEKFGTGKLTLSAPNSYTGSTTIGSGVLELASTASLPSALIVVSNGATFDVSGFGSGFDLASAQILGGNGSVNGSVVAAAGAVINPGYYGGGTLRFSNNLTLNGTASKGVTNVFYLSPTPGGNNSSIAITGLLAIHGTNAIQISYSTLSPGTYHLITYGSESLGAGVQWSLAGFLSTGPQTAGIVDTGAGQINLMVTGSPGALTWIGDGTTNNWDTTTPNWSNQVTLLAQKFSNGEVVTFNDIGSENPTVPVQLVGALAPGSILVSNSGNYVFSGAGSLGGESGLTKSGAGSLTLLESGGDAFAGGILLGNGSLILSNAGVNISGGLTVTNGALTLAHSGTISGGLSMNTAAGGSPSALVVGSGTLNGGIVAAGSLIISNSPVLSGGLVVNSGAALLDQTTTPSGATTIASGATLQVGNNDANGNLPASTVANNGILVFNQSASVTVSNAISGSGTIEQVGANAITLGGNNSAFTGTIMVTNGILKAASKNALGAATVTTVVTDSGTFDVNGIAFNSAQPTLTISGAGFTNAGAVVNSGVSQHNAFSNITVAANVVIGGSQRWDIRATSATDASLNASPPGTPYKITKVGTNQISLVDVGTIDPGLGDIDVQQGMLSIQLGTVSPGNAASNLFVRAGATLQMWSLSNALNKVITFYGSGTNDTYYAEDGSSSNNIIIGPVTLNGSCWFDISNGIFATFGGGIGGSGSLVKIDTGTLTLTNANTYTGATVVSNGTLALGSESSISNTSGVSIGSGATLDVSALGASATFVMPGAAYAASGSPTATIVGPAGGTVSLGALPVSLTVNSVAPGLTISQGTLSLTGNGFTVNTSSGLPLPAGLFNIIRQTTGNITGTVSPTVAGTAIPTSGTSNFVAVSGGNVVLHILTLTTTALTLASGANPCIYGAALDFHAAISPASVVPDGETVNFYSGATLLGSGVTSGGGADLVISTLAPSVYAITATYVGDTTNTASTSPALAQTVTVNPAPFKVAFSVSGSQLTLSWPADHVGWTLETNSVDLSQSSDWFPYAGSTTNTSATITIAPAQPHVYFRTQATSQ